jgi:hypothetical protein
MRPVRVYRRQIEGVWVGLKCFRVLSCNVASARLDYANVILKSSTLFRCSNNYEVD